MSRQELLELPVVVDLQTAARALRIGRTKAYRLAAAGEFPVPVFRTGGRYRVPTADLIALIDGPAATTTRAEWESEHGQDGDQ